MYVKSKASCKHVDNWAEGGIVSMSKQEKCLTDFEHNPPHGPRRLGDIDALVVLRVGGDSEDLRGEFDRVA